jgi:hypothetical protein
MITTGIVAGFPASWPVHLDQAWLAIVSKPQAAVIATTADNGVTITLEEITGTGPISCAPTQKSTAFPTGAVDDHNRHRPRLPRELAGAPGAGVARDSIASNLRRRWPTRYISRHMSVGRSVPLLIHGDLSCGICSLCCRSRWSSRWPVVR